MRNLWLAGLVLHLVLQSWSDAQSAQSGVIYFAGGQKSGFERTVTISKNGTVITSFTLPKGTFLSASDQNRNAVALPGGRFELQVPSNCASCRRPTVPGDRCQPRTS